MTREVMLAELDRLLDSGEPLLTVFPQTRPDSWWLQLPDKISYDMWWYANAVAYRAWDSGGYQDFRRQDTTDLLAELVKDCEAGLLGWRAIGVLK